MDRELVLDRDDGRAWAEVSRSMVVLLIRASFSPSPSFVGTVAGVVNDKAWLES